VGEPDCVGSPCGAILTTTEPDPVVMMRRFFSAVLALLAATSASAQVYAPPQVGVTTVTVDFFLLNLDSVSEKDETFDADLYLEYEWDDPRLAHNGSEEQLFADAAVDERLTTMWWPQIEYVNTSEPTVTNQSLEIFPSGHVKHTVGLTTTFRANLDLRRFPFDRQRLDVRIQSFLYDADRVRLIPSANQPGWEHDSTYEELRVTGVTAESRIVQLSGRTERFAEFQASIVVVRNWAFYLWTVFGPVVLIFLIACAVFLVPLEAFADRVSICLTALLACIATHFAISFNLPHVGYLTVIDRLFVLTYAFVALLVMASAAELLVRRNAIARRRVNVLAAVLLPLTYLVVIAAAILR
jgi:hypothetical protein